jgi:hypothetical protein
MKLDKLLNELQAEIVQGKIPVNKIYNLKGNIVNKTELQNSNFIELVREIKNAIQKAGILDQFSQESGEMDIKPYRKNEYLLSPENGPKYIYNFITKKIIKKNV